MSDSRQPVLIYLDAYQICIAECLILIEAILPIILGKNTAHECKKSTFGWLASLRNVFA